MKKYRNDIKEDVLMAGGATTESYYKVRTLNASGYDPIDEIIITAARNLKRSYKRVFGMAYECHSAQAAQERLKEKGYGPVRDETFRKYLRESKTEIINLATKEKEIKKIKKVLQIEYEKSNS